MNLEDMRPLGNKHCVGHCYAVRGDDDVCSAKQCCLRQHRVGHLGNILNLDPFVRVQVFG